MKNKIAIRALIFIVLAFPGWIQAADNSKETDISNIKIQFKNAPSKMQRARCAFILSREIEKLDENTKNEILSTALEDVKSEDYGHYSAKVLGEFYDKSQSRNAIYSLLSSTSQVKTAQLRKNTALQIIGKKKDPNASRLIIKLLDDKSMEKTFTPIRAIYALGAIGNQESVSYLCNRFEYEKKEKLNFYGQSAFLIALGQSPLQEAKQYLLKVLDMKDGRAYLMPVLMAFENSNDIGNIAALEKLRSEKKYVKEQKYFEDAINGIRAHKNLNGFE